MVKGFKDGLDWNLNLEDEAQLGHQIRLLCGLYKKERRRIKAIRLKMSLIKNVFVATRARSWRGVNILFQYANNNKNDSINC